MKVFVSALAVSLLSTIAATPVDSEQRFAAVEQVVEDAMETHGVLGVSIAIIEGYQVIYARSFGDAEPGRPVDVDTLFQAASLSKPISGLVAAAAADAGLIDLNTDVAEMLTSWQLPPADFDIPITVRMLLAHRAGINVHGFPGYPLDETPLELPRILFGVRDHNEPIRVVEEPGAAWRYSGGGYLIAQQAVEDHTGQTWEDLFETLVFDPLGLELSTFRILAAADRSRVAVGYRLNGSEVAGGGWHQYPETAPASLWTTPTEYAAMVIDVMHSYEDGTGAVLDQPTARLILDPDFAVGFGVSREEGGIATAHGGANEGYRCYFVAVPHLGEGVVVMTNNDVGDLLYPAVADAVAEEFSWPWAGSSTPLWAVVLAFLALLALATWLVVRRRAKRIGPPSLGTTTVSG